MTDLVVGTAIIVHNANHNVLLGLRTGSHGPGLWNLPGGKPDDGEDPKSAVIRELREETGIDILSPELVKPVPHWSYDVFEPKRFVTIFFHVRVEITRRPKLMEPEKCHGWAFVPNNLLPDPLFPGTAEAIQVWRDS